MLSKFTRKQEFCASKIDLVLQYPGGNIAFHNFVPFRFVFLVNFETCNLLNSVKQNDIFADFSYKRNEFALHREFAQQISVCWADFTNVKQIRCVYKVFRQTGVPRVPFAQQVAHVKQIPHLVAHYLLRRFAPQICSADCTL